MNRKRMFVGALVAVVFASTCSHGVPQDLSAAREEISLDGTWDIVFDPSNKGREAAWHLDRNFSILAERRAIEVPQCWELIQQDYEGVAFYRRIFEVPAAWSERVVRLHFDAVNYLAEVWLNDEVVGYHEGGFTPFEFRVDEILEPGATNVLTLRVVGPIVLSEKSVDGVGPMETPQWRGGIAGGIWQPVHLVSSGDVYVKDVYIEPKIAEKTTIFHVQLDHTGIEKASVVIEIDIFEADDLSKNVAQVRDGWMLRPGTNERDWEISIPDAKLWSPDEPCLYQSTLRLIADGRESDYWSQRFGMRELTIKDKDFHLNGKPVYIKAAFIEGLYPQGIAYPDSEAMARREIQLAKEAGFNMLRPWRRPSAPRWLDLADEMGVMVVGSPALECMQLPLSSPYLPSRVENEIRQTILRDRNRASVVQWELFNELHRPILKQMMRPMALMARELDQTRLILDESGGWAFGANTYLPYEYEPTKFNDIHSYPGPFINEEIYEGFLSIGMTVEEKTAMGLKGRTPGRNVLPGLMSFVSELGYGSLPDLVDNNRRFRQQGNPLAPAYRYHQRLAVDQQRMLQESGFSDLYPDLRQFCLDQQAIHGAANKRMIEAVRSNPEVDGYCIHALTAGDWIFGAGLLDLWRNPKSRAYEATKAANQPRILSVRMRPRNVYAERGAALQITGINELKPLEAMLVVEVASVSGEVVFRRRLETEWSSGVSPLLREQLQTRAFRGNYRVRTRVFEADDTVVAEDTCEFDVFSEEDLKVPKGKIAVLDLTSSLTPFLRKAGIDFLEFDESTSHSTPVLVTSTQARSVADETLFSCLQKFIKEGGTAVFISGTGESFKGGRDTPIESTGFPFSAKLHAARGLWTCIPHLVRDHPVFQGLPSKGMMRDIYENVWAIQTVRDLDGEVLVASIGYDWFSQDHKLHYSGPGKSWWGSDMALVTHGDGRCLVSQLRIIENLGKDPVADKLLFNIVRYVTQ